MQPHFPSLESKIEDVDCQRLDSDADCQPDVTAVAISLDRERHGAGAVGQSDAQLG
jgi:hypothetical protein